MRYETLDVWKRSRLLAIAVYRELKVCRDFGFKDQMTRSALSVPSNIAEGYERESLKERARFLIIARGSCGELKTQIDIGIEIELINRELGMQWLSECDQLAKILTALINRSLS